MTFVWTIVWLIAGTPNLTLVGHSPGWLIALLVCAVLDLIRTS